MFQQGRLEKIHKLSRFEQLLCHVCLTDVQVQIFNVP